MKDNSEAGNAVFYDIYSDDESFTFTVMFPLTLCDL